ncbi:hypothetical protein RND81_06G034700 [Saponaria officinalis]|uniref:BHLH domain-containing protein n=1 Tax=Saponaria officinalis TaxID=3572 RepID=A0AAW1K9B5_SAPOF
MDAWLSEMEMAMNEDPILINNFHENEEYYSYQQSEDINTLNEELTAFLGEDFNFTNFDTEKNSISSLFDNYDTSKNPTNNLLNDEQIPPLSNFIIPTYNSNDTKIISDKKYSTSEEEEEERTEKVKFDGSERVCGKKRRRDPVQVHGHIMAERKRRELLSQRFIALSALVPGLKKIDKTTVLEETIKYLQEMREKVKQLEETTSKQAVGSIMVVKRTPLIIEDDNNQNTVETVNGCSTTCSSGGSDGMLPEIQVKVTRNTILLRICCVKRKGILAKIYDEVENRGMIVLTTGVVPFESSALDISITAQMEGAAGDEEKVKELLRSLHSVLN